MFLIDIAVPRDIDPAANKLDSIYLYDVDDLQGVVQANLKERQKEAEKAELIINDEVKQFQTWLGTLEVKPTIVALRRKMDTIRQAEMEKTLANLGHLNDKERKAVAAMSSAIVNKILHQPTSILKQASGNGNGSLYVDTIRTLFDLPDHEEHSPESDPPDQQ